MEAEYIDAAETVIRAVIDGQELTVPADPGNRHYRAIVAAGVTITPYTAPPAPPVYVSRYVVVQRLDAAGLLADAHTALEAASLSVRMRWEAATEIAVDDPDAHALLASIGADPAVILAPVA